MKECCDVLYHNYVDPASIYRILPQIRPDLDPSRIQIHCIRLDPDPTWIHQIHRISGRIQIWIRCTSSWNRFFYCLDVLLNNPTSWTTIYRTNSQQHKQHYLNKCCMKNEDEVTYLASRKRDRSIMTASHVLCFSCSSMAVNLRRMIDTIRSISFGAIGRVRLCSRSRLTTWLVNSLHAWKPIQHRYYFMIYSKLKYQQKPTSSAVDTFG